MVMAVVAALRLLLWWRWRRLAVMVLAAVLFESRCTVCVMSVGFSRRLALPYPGAERAPISGQEVAEVVLIAWDVERFERE